MIRWRRQPDAWHVEAVDAYWVSAAQHGMNASTFTARHRLDRSRRRSLCPAPWAPSAARCTEELPPLTGPAHDRGCRADRRRHGYTSSDVLEAKGERLMGFGHRVYRVAGPRAARPRDHLRASGARHASRRGLGLEKAALDELQARRRPDRGPGHECRVLGRLGSSGLRRGPLRRCSRRCSPVRARPGGLPMCSSRSDRRRSGPSARYVGPGPRPIEDVEGFDPAR